MPRISLTAIALLGAIAAPAAAQFTQYTAPGDLARRTESKTEQAQRSAAEAPWQLGRVALDPRFSIRDIGYYENVFSSPDESQAVDDYRGTVGAGLAAYLGLGPKSLFSAYVTPEYSWWRDQSDLSELSVNYGVGWFASFNRLEVSASASLLERERPLSDEIGAPVRIETESREVRSELELAPSLVLIANAERREIRHARDVDALVPELNASSLDRDDERLSAALAFDFRKLRIGAGIETADVDFLVDPEGRSNKGDSPLVQLEFEGERFEFDLVAIDRRLDFENPELGRQELSLGSGRFGIEVGEQLTVTFYAARNVGFATFDEDGYLVNERGGGSIAGRFRQRYELTVFGEIGSSEFRETGGSDRVDDLEAFGAQLLVPVSEQLTLSLRISDTSWDSNLPAFDRSQRSFGVSLQLAQDLLPW